MLRAEGDAGDDDRAFFQQHVAHKLLELGDYSGSEGLLRDCLDVYQRGSKNNGYMTTSEYLLGVALLGQKRLREASEALSSAVNRAREGNAPRWRIERIRNALGEVLYRQGRISEGSRMLRESYDRLTKDPATNATTTRIVKKRMKWFAGVTRNNLRSKRTEPATASPPYPAH